MGFDSKKRCERKNFNAIDLEVQLDLNEADAASFKKWDVSDIHTWRGK